MSFFGDVFGSRPSVPKVPQLDLSTEVSKALSTSTSNLPAAEALTASANAFSQQQLQQMLEASIPGFANIQKNVASSISSEVSGQLPSDVRDLVANAAASQAVAGGFGGSAMAHNLVARDLGLTSLDLMNQGMSTAQSWAQTMNSLFAPGQMNVTSMFISPEQQASFDVNERNVQSQQQWLAAQAAAMPDPSSFASLISVPLSSTRSLAENY